MHTNAAGLKIIKDAEGLRLNAYPDPGTGGAPWTIGYGHTGPDVHPGLTITSERATELLAADLARFELAVSSLCPVTTENQFSALVSFAYNLGPGALKGSTLCRLHNEGRYIEAAAQFQRWNKAAGQVLPGLTKRRAAEAALYRK
jgi:lysozyme